MAVKERAFTTIEEAEQFITALTRAQSMLLAAILRPLLANSTLTESDLRQSLIASETAAMQRRTRETSAFVGLIAVLRADLGWIAEIGPSDAPPRPS
jgi:hypothetical protein